MMAVVGSDAGFDRGREQLQLLAGFHDLYRDHRNRGDFGHRLLQRDVGARPESGQPEGGVGRWCQLDLEHRRQPFPGAIQIVDIWASRRAA